MIGCSLHVVRVSWTHKPVSIWHLAAGRSIENSGLPLDLLLCRLVGRELESEEVLMFQVDATGFMRGPGRDSSWNLVVGVLMQSPTNVCQMHMLGPTLTGFPVVALRNVNYPKGNNNCHELAMRPQGVLAPPSLPAFTVILLQHSNCPWYVPCQLPLFYSAQSRTSA